MTECSLKISFSKLANHNRSLFNCGDTSLNTYFHLSAGQDNKKNVSVTYIMLLGEEIVGFYTLSANSILLADLPPERAKKLPRYDKIPVTLLGRLAVSLPHQRKGFGSLLLADALKRSLASASEIGSYAVIVDAKNIEAEKFYLTFGFLPFAETRKLYMPMQTVAQGFAISSNTSTKQGKKKP